MPNRRSTKGYDFKPLSHDVIGACIDVQRQLGVHCMEVDYQRALELALPKRGLRFQRELEIPIAYDGVIITKRRVDFIIWNDTDELILETKARSAILPENVEQCLLYLHPSRELSLVLARQLWGEASGRAALCAHTQGPAIARNLRVFRVLS